MSDRTETIYPTPTVQENPEWVDYSHELRIKKQPWLRGIFVVAGLVSIGVGILGYILPGLPGTAFILLAAWLFMQSSPRFYNQMMNHKTIGTLIRDYREGRGLPRRVKMYVPFMIAFTGFGSAAYLTWGVGLPWVGIFIALFALYGIIYVIRMPTKVEE